MKQGRYLKLVNNTPYDWVKAAGHSHEMLIFNLPGRIRAGTSASVYVEWEVGEKNYKGKNIGDATYCLEGTTDIFQVQAKGDENNVILLVYCENLITDSSRKGESIPLDLNPYGDAIFILFGTHDNYYLIDEESNVVTESLQSYGETELNNRVGLLETGYNAENAYWEAETGSVSNINNLYFPGDKKWMTCLVEVRGTKRNQNFFIQVKADGKIVASEEFSLKENEIRVIERSIHKACSIDVTGRLKSDGSGTAGGSIYITCVFDPEEQYKSESIIWSAMTEGISSIDNLCLYAAQVWEKCEIHIDSFENKNTGCMITLITNGEILKGGRIDWMELNSAQSRTYSFEIHKKVPLLAAGYISNPAIIGGGASITLTGFYK